MKPDQLLAAALARKSVTGFGLSRNPMPAAFLASMQFTVVMRVLPRLKLYRPKPKTKKPKYYERSTIIYKSR